MVLNAISSITNILEQGSCSKVFLFLADVNKFNEVLKSLKKGDKDIFFVELLASLKNLYEAGDDLKIELDLNKLEDEDKQDAYFHKLWELLDNKFDLLIEGINKADLQKLVADVTHNINLDRFDFSPNKHYSLVQILVLFSKTISHLQGILIDFKTSIISPEQQQDCATKILYLEFSGMLNQIRDGYGKPLTQRKLSEIIAFISSESSTHITVLLSQLGHIKRKKPHKAFTKKMIEVANNQLDKDGFSAPELDAVLLEMDKQKLVK